MLGIFARHDFLWNVHHAHTNDAVDTRHDVIVSDAGHNGRNGRDGAPGDMTNPPGGGIDGADATGSQAGLANGAALAFEHNPVNPSWTVSATSGRGGHGGAGGDIGSFPDDPTYAIPDAGSGGIGGDSGQADADLIGRTVFGHTGTTADVGIAIAITAVTGNAGAGGNGGVGNGDASGGGFGGSGGNGGNAGFAFAELSNDTFKAVSDAGDPNDFRITLTLVAKAGDGGDGGDGGHGVTMGIASLDGPPGTGGNAGGANAIFMNDTIQLGGRSGGTAIATFIASATGGDGGDGGDVPGGAFGGGHGTPGDAGGASAIFANMEMGGGAADDTVRLALNAVAGHAGTNGAGDHGADASAIVSVHDCTIDGGRGVNTLAFSWTGNATSAAVNINLDTGIFQVAGGSSNMLTRFQNATGGSGFDALTGDSHANVLDGALGDDLLTGSDGNDRLIGGNGDDSMNGGSGSDTFVYNAISDSSGTVFDHIGDLNFSQDKIDLTFAVSGTNRSIGATIHADTFDGDMEGAAHALRSHHAVLLLASGGDFDGHTFLLIDANGHRGYQAGHDMIIDVTGATNHFDAGVFI